MVTEPTSTVRARRLRERRSRGIVMVAPVEIGEGGINLLMNSGKRPVVRGLRIMRQKT